jgi:hypothetical protein
MGKREKEKLQKEKTETPPKYTKKNTLATNPTPIKNPINHSTTLTLSAPTPCFSGELNPKNRQRLI